jgi:hypothetical protein
MLSPVIKVLYLQKHAFETDYIPCICETCVPGWKNIPKLIIKSAKKANNKITEKKLK